MQLETSRHLFQRPSYRGEGGAWNSGYRELLNSINSNVSLDVAAVASVLSFGMVGGERTMLEEIRRQPWMSRIDPTGAVHEPVVPMHGRFSGPDDQLAARLYELLRAEAREACEGFNEIYVLLSGGLDSRIVAGVLADLYRSGEIRTQPVAVTWGAARSRDVVYGKRMAGILGFEWEHAEFGPEDVLENIEATVQDLGLLHSPEMLHGMLWFRNVPSDSLVVAGSFGDSIGRAEFSGQHLLQLQPKTPINAYQVMQPNAFAVASIGLNRDLSAIHSRATGEMSFLAKNEHWMQGFRMRGGLCHALSIINSFANVYQMFTAPAVYEFMWSLHPARRDDNIYATLLDKYLPELARVPWPRTNRALSGRTSGADSSLDPQYHEYTKWSSGPLFAELSEKIDPDWFNETGIFRPESIVEMNDLVSKSQQRVGRLNDIWLWLAGFRSFSDSLERSGKKLHIESNWPDVASEKPQATSILLDLGIFAASKSTTVNSVLKRARSFKRRMELKRLKSKALRQHPPVKLC